jgi:bla regulator protein BlaR1
MFSISLQRIPMPRLSICLAVLLAATAMNASAQRPQAQPQQPCEKPVMPPEAVEGRWSGSSTIFLLVGADGTVKDAKVTRSSGHRALDKAAQAAFSRCRFKPAMEGGQPVQAWQPIEYAWAPE